MATEVKSWNIKDLYRAWNRVDREYNRQILVPSFQRGLVWGEDKRAELINSLRAGYPVGAILLAQKGVNNSGPSEVTEYALLDGLQRTNAICKYLENPLSHAKGIIQELEIGRSSTNL